MRERECARQEKMHGCPYATAQKLLTGKWSILLLHLLAEKTYRFGELQRKLGIVTQTTLTKQLRFLEAHRLIDRTVYATIPPRVEYRLSEAGADFLPVLKELEQFGKKYLKRFPPTAP